MKKHFTADQLKAWREGHGWTQAIAAARILLSLDGYRKKEQGRSPINERDMALIENTDEEEAEKKATA